MVGPILFFYLIESILVSFVIDNVWLICNLNSLINVQISYFNFLGIVFIIKLTLNNIIAISTEIEANNNNNNNIE
jgi:hypothetical protein